MSVRAQEASAELSQPMMSTSRLGPSHLQEVRIGRAQYCRCNRPGHPLAGRPARTARTSTSFPAGQRHVIEFCGSDKRR